MMITTREKQTQHKRNLIRNINGNPIKAIESTFRITNAMGKLINYKLMEPHKRMLRTGMLGDKSALMRIINKGRQGGFSIFQAVESSSIAQLNPNTNQYYVATKEDQAKSWLDKVELMSKNSRTSFDGTPIIDINTVKSSHLRKVFQHVPRETMRGVKKALRYSYITGFAASPAGIRGETGIKVILDEFPNMVQREHQQRDVYAAIGFFIAQGGGTDIQGTPLVRSDMFWDMYSNCQQYLMKPYYFPIIENWEELDLMKPLVIELDELCQDEIDKIMNLGIYKIHNNVIVNKVMKNNIAMQNMVIPYDWYDVGFLEQKRREDLGLFRQEVLGVPEDVRYRFIPPELYLPNETEEENLRGVSHLTYKIGIDVAQMRDVTAITVGHKLQNGKIIEDYVWETQSTYPEQAREIATICSWFPTTDEILLDNTGAGIGLGDILEEDVQLPMLRRVDFRSSVDVPGDNGRPIKIPEILAMEFKKSLIAKKYGLLNHPIAKAHVLRVERIATDTFNIRYTGKRGKERDDHFWSKCLLNLGFSDKYGSLITGMGAVGGIGMPTGSEQPMANQPVQDNDGILMW